MANWKQDIRFFTISISVLLLVDILAGVYFRSALTTIERRFELSTTRVALLTSAYQIGNLAVVIFVSYYGSKSHRPRFIACGSSLVAIGYIISSLPQFFGGTYEYIDITKENNIDSGMNVQICRGDLNDSSVNHTSACNKVENGDSGNNLFILIVAGTMLSGIGAAPLQPLGLSYIDDYSEKRKTPVYIGIVTTIGLIGPTFGFLLGSVILKIWVDVGWVDTSQITITPVNPNWVGAWWIGCILSGILIGIATIPIYFFPKKMKAQSTSASKANSLPEYPFSESKVTEAKDKEIDDDNRVNGRNGGIFRAAKKLLCNPTYMLLVLRWTIEGIAIVGIITFFPKYLEIQFGVSASQANMYYGAIGIPCLAVGTMLGSFIMKRWNPDSLGMAKMILMARVFCTVLATTYLFIGCETIDIRGVTAPHIGSSAESAISVTSSCNSKCQCEGGVFSPVCGADGLTYVSPCYAGCKDTYSTISGIVQNYTDCNCINPNNNTKEAHWSYPGRCRDTNCGYYTILILAITALGSLGGGVSATPSYVFLMRSVEQKHKSFAIGLSFMLVRLLAWIPGPLLFGKVFDSTCLYWTANECGKKGYCRVYDNNALRTKFYSICVSMDIAGVICMSIIYNLTKRNKSASLDRKQYALEKLKENEAMLKAPGNSTRVAVRLASTESEDNLEVKDVDA